MVSSDKTVPLFWSHATTKEGKRKIREYYSTINDSGFAKQIRMMDIEWTTETPSERESIKTTHQDKDDYHVRQTK